MPQPSSRDRFIDALRAAIADAQLIKLTLGKYRGDDDTLKQLFVRPVSLKSGPHYSFVWRHQTRDVTKNVAADETLAALETLIGDPFRDAHLFTPLHHAQLETRDDGHTRVRIKTAAQSPPSASSSHDRTKTRLIDSRAGWLRDLGITDAQGQPRAGQSAKFRQIQKFAEILQSLEATRGPLQDPIRVADMGSGKGYLTFATRTVLGERARVTGIERRKDLVDTCNRVAQDHGLTNLEFKPGDIADTISDLGSIDVLIALHACDTATDDALMGGIRAGARTLVVAPCCQKEIRPQLVAPPVLQPALRHGIFQERQAEFVTDALRAMLLEAAGFETRVFEFVAVEHTAKNLMLVAQRTGREASPRLKESARQKCQEFARFYGIKTQALATALGISL